MKTVFTSSELPHIWAHQSAPYGKSPSNGSFQGRIYRSYATDIAVIVETGKTVILNVTSYSNTTAKQQNRIWQAVDHYANVLRLGDLGRSEVLRGEPKELARKVIEWNLSEAVKCAAQAKRARTYGENYLTSARNHVAMANKANEVFKLKRKPLDVNELDTLAVKLAEQQKRETAKERKAQAEREAQQAQARAERLERVKLAFAEWRAGRQQYSHEFYSFAIELFPIGLFPVVDGFQPNAALRLSVDGTRVETSQGAQVRSSWARFLWSYCADARAKGEAVASDIVERFPALDHYAVRSIDSRGNLTVGCHRIAFDEVASIARQLNLPPFDGMLPDKPYIPEEVESIDPHGTLTVETS